MARSAARSDDASANPALTLVEMPLERVTVVKAVAPDASVGA
jgi:hypothetical protein